MKKLIALLLVLLLGLSLFACGKQEKPTSGASPSSGSSGTGGMTEAGGETADAGTDGEAGKQEGTPHAVLFDRAGYRLILERYSYTQNEELELTFSTEAPEGANPEEVSYSIDVRSINGWSFGGSMRYPDRNLDGFLRPSENTASISLNNRTDNLSIQLAQIQQLQQIEFEIRGSVNYERIGDRDAMFTLDLTADAESGYVQPIPESSAPLLQNVNHSFASIGVNEEEQELYLLHTYPAFADQEGRPSDPVTVVPVVNGIQGVPRNYDIPEYGTKEIIRLSYSAMMTALNLSSADNLAVNINGTVFPIRGEAAVLPASLDALPVLYQDESIKVSFVQWLLGDNWAGPNPFILVQPLSERMIVKLSDISLQTVSNGKSISYSATVEELFSDDCAVFLAQPYAQLITAREYYNHGEDHGYPDPFALESAELTFDVINDLSETTSVRCPLDAFIPQLLPQGEGLVGDAETPIFESEYGTVYYLGSEPTEVDGVPTKNLLFDVQPPSGENRAHIMCDYKATLCSGGGGRGSSNLNGVYEVPAVADRGDAYVDVTEGLDTIYVKVTTYRDEDSFGGRTDEGIAESGWILLKLR